jgi:16S rRNA (uracil1498-N3)-methyltransferase
VLLDPHAAHPLDPAEPYVRLADGTLHHLRRVLRLADGAALSITDGAGRRAMATLGPDGARLTSEVQTRVRQRPELVLVQALAKGKRLDDAVRSVCELGVDRIVPLVAERTQGRPGPEEREATRVRWQALAVSALEQSRSNWLTQVGQVDTLGGLLGASDAAELRLIAVPGAPALPDVLTRTLDEVGASVGEDRVSRLSQVSIAIGPEGGWTSEEIDRTSDAGWRPVGLGPSVLRAEHAGLVALSVIAAATGRWRPER